VNTALRDPRRRQVVGRGRSPAPAGSWPQVRPRSTQKSAPTRMRDDRAANGTPVPGEELGVLALEHVKGPELARCPHRAALPMLSVPRGEVLTCEPGSKIVLRAPARHHQANLAIVVGPKQLEPLKPDRSLDSPGSRRESFLELGKSLPRHGDRVDLDDAHLQDLMTGVRRGAAGSTASRRAAACPEPVRRAVAVEFGTSVCRPATRPLGFERGSVKPRRSVSISGTARGGSAVLPRCPISARSWRRRRRLSPRPARAITRRTVSAPASAKHTSPAAARTG
jgi:hypothetical protein